MLLLELFSGTGSVRRAFERRGWAVHSLDVDPRAPDVTFRCDIEEWEPSDFTYDHVHASPPCVHYSRARTTAATPRDLEGSDRLAQRALDIIEFYRQKNPNLTWTLENPQSGLLPARAVVAGLPFADADYGCYDSDKGYRKRKFNLGGAKMPRCWALSCHGGHTAPFSGAAWGRLAPGRTLCNPRCLV